MGLKQRVHLSDQRNGFSQVGIERRPGNDSLGLAAHGFDEFRVRIARILGDQKLGVVVELLGGIQKQKCVRSIGRRQQHIGVFRLEPLNLRTQGCGFRLVTDFFDDFEALLTGHLLLRAAAIRTPQRIFVNNADGFYLVIILAVEIVDEFKHQLREFTVMRGDAEKVFKTPCREFRRGRFAVYPGDSRAFRDLAGRPGYGRVVGAKHGMHLVGVNHFLGFANSDFSLAAVIADHD